MRPSHRCLHVFAALALIACSGAVSAGEPATTADRGGEEARPTFIQRVSHLFQPGWGHAGTGTGVVQYHMFSPHYALWQSPDLYVDDMRCRPVEWAPQGYGYPKKTSCIRMDYAPYRVLAPMASHGPAVWPRSFREPCCNCGHLGTAGTHCEQCGRSHCPLSPQYAPQQ